MGHIKYIDFVSLAKSVINDTDWNEWHFELILTEYQFQDQGLTLPLQGLQSDYV